MKIIVDNKIPFIEGVLEPYAEVIYMTGIDISASDIKDADALIIRTRTICNQTLLKNSSVKLIITATIGYDHIDTLYCKENNIIWYNAPGCNAGSVMQYVAASLAILAKKEASPLQKLTLGIVGVGHVGRQVEILGRLLGMQVLLNDPPRAEQEGFDRFVDIQQIKETADIITFHTPLQREGKHATFHLVDDHFIAQCKKTPYLINTCRGEVIDNESLKKALNHKKLKGAIIDCWEHEPRIDLELMKLCELATPHIAGYSCNGKANGTTTSVQNLSRFFNLPLNNWQVNTLPSLEQTTFEADANSTILDIILFTYPIREDSERLKQNAQEFEKQRGNYPIRLEFGNFQVHFKEKNKKLRTLCEQLGFKCV